jgi:ABC-2 type transport system ATP-binding protein
VPCGAICGLIGPNGAGKTTTLDLLMGMGRKDRGEVRVLGMDLSRDEIAIKRKIGYVNPDLNFQPWGTVGGSIDFVRGFYPDWDAAHCERLLSEFGLGRNEKIVQLSFGARTKLALVLVLSRQADLLLLDEPTVGLDVGSRLKLFSELLAFMQREDRTIIISSNQLSDVERFADHVAIIDRGRLVAFGRLDELVDRYHQVDVRLANGAASAAMEGTYAIQRDGDRERLVVDRSVCPLEKLRSSQCEILAEIPLTLEEVFIALVGRSSL